MRLAIRRVPGPRLPRVPLWSVLLVLVWGSLLVAKAWMERRGAQPFDLCLFHRVTGRPCPTCGSTRAVLALSQGAFGEALAWNPLSVLLLSGLALALALRAATGTRLVLDADRPARRLLWAACALAVAFNWAWVWDRV